MMTYHRPRRGALVLVAGLSAACSQPTLPPQSTTTVVAPTAATTASVAPTSGSTKQLSCPATNTMSNFALSADRAWLTTGCAGYEGCTDENPDTNMDVWDVQKGQIGATLDAGQNNILTMAFGPGGHFVSVANPHTGVATVRLFSVGSWAQKHDMSFYCTGTAEFDPMGNFLALVGCDGNIATVKLSDLTVLYRPESEAHLGGDYGVSLDYTPDGQTILVMDEYNGFQVLSASTLIRKAPPRDIGRIAREALSPARTQYAAVNDAGELYAFDSQKPTQKPSRLSVGKAGDVKQLLWLGEKRLLVSAEPSILAEWDLSKKSTSKKVVVTGLHSTPYLYSDPSASSVVMVDERGTVILWDAATGAAKQLDPGRSAANSDDLPKVEWSRDGDRVLLQTRQTLRVFDKSGNLVAQWQLGGDQANTNMTWIHKGEIIADANQTLHLYRVSDAAVLHLQSVVHNDHRIGLVSSPNGTWSGPEELAHCALPDGTFKGRRVQRPSLLSDFLAGLPITQN
ncbi:MAG: WD40 repeat domain-containing protein [Polyangiaceae bacterium]|nr:WD40 repeat domain-containing protein [Polyangiaceae bacterium]